MVASKENFLKAHWDWLVAIAGLAALCLAGFYLFSSLGQSPEDAAAACSSWMDSELKKPHKGVDAVDLKVLAKAAGQLKAPPALREVDAKKKSFLASERRVFCQNGDETDKKNKGCGKPIHADAERCPLCGAKQHVVKVEVDSDNDGLPNDWEKKYGLNPNDPADADLDKDGDGFTNREEFEAKAQAWYYAEILRDERKRQKLTQQQLGERIGKKREYISSLEHGQTDMQLSTFMLIANALGLRFSLVVG